MKCLKLGCCTDCLHFDIVIDDYPCVSIPLCYELKTMLIEDMLTRKSCRKYEPKYADVQMRFGTDIQELEGRDKKEAINILKDELREIDTIFSLYGFLTLERWRANLRNGLDVGR